jgi:hypothetical protein
MSNATFIEVAGIATAYAAFTSCGFLVAVALAWLVLYRCTSLTSNGGGGANLGAFGRLMLFIESIDAIPEAMVIAGATADGRMTISFAVSVFLLNVVNTLSTAIDLLATKPERFLHRLLVILIFFSVGSLFFTISSTVFESFLEHVHHHDANYMLLLPVFGGVIAGVLLVWGILVIQQKCMGRRTTSREDDLQPVISDPVITLRNALDRERSLLNVAVDSAEQDVMTETPPPLYTHANHKQQTISYYKERVGKLELLVDQVENIGRLSDSMNLPITDDARDVIEDALLDQLGTMHHQTRSLDIENVAGSLHRRTARLFGIMVLLSLWTMSLTFGLTPLFMVLDTRMYAAAGYLNAFADGLSGGAFLAIISSTMIPRIQHDAYRSHWSSLMFRSVGMIAFVTGISAAFLLEFIPSPGGGGGG